MGFVLDYCPLLDCNVYYILMVFYGSVLQCVTSYFDLPFFSTSLCFTLYFPFFCGSSTQCFVASLVQIRVFVWQKDIYVLLLSQLLLLCLPPFVAFFLFLSVFPSSYRWPNTFPETSLFFCVTCLIHTPDPCNYDKVQATLKHRLELFWLFLYLQLIVKQQFMLFVVVVSLLNHLSFDYYPPQLSYNINLNFV